MVTSGAADMAENLYAVIGWIPFDAFSQASIQQFLSLVMIAIACILMGAGLPTTALYIMLVAVAQPALAQLGVPPLATHMFVLYYGVISEITPPVCASAYAAAGIAGANPFRTGVSAFTPWVGQAHGAHGICLCAGNVDCIAGVFFLGRAISGNHHLCSRCILYCNRRIRLLSHASKTHLAHHNGYCWLALGSTKFDQ